MNILRFIIEGTEVQMGDAKMNLNLLNPMFEEVGSYSLPMKITRSSNNNRAFNMTFKKRYDAILYLGPQPLYGEYIVSGYNDSYIDGYFTTGISTFRDLVRGKLLTDVDYTEEIIGPVSGYYTSVLNSAAASSYPTYNYTCFPLRTPHFYDPISENYNTMMNPWSYKSGDSSYQGFMKDFPQRYAPSFYLCFVISKIFEEYGYVIESNDLYDDTELRSLVITNFNCGYKDTVSRQYDLKFSNALPRIPINEFISGIENLFNVTFFIDNAGKSVIVKKKTSVVKSEPVATLKLLHREMVQEQETDGFQLSYTMDQDDSHATITDIDGLSVGVTVDNRSDLSGYLAASYPNQLAFITNNDLYYISKRDDSEPTGWVWEELTRDYFDYVDGEGELEFKTDVNPILTESDVITDEYSITEYEEYALLPRVNNSSINSYGWQEFESFSSLRLLFFRGIVASGGRPSDPSTQECSYPLASPDVYRAYTTVANTWGRTKISTANQSLRWAGQYGLYETHWKDYLYWYQNIRRAAKDYYHLTLRELLDIKFWEKYRAGGQSLIFKSINLELDFERQTIIPQQCEVFLS